MVSSFDLRNMMNFRTAYRMGYEREKLSGSVMAATIHGGVS
jgi:hypothetical protein